MDKKKKESKQSGDSVLLQLKKQSPEFMCKHMTARKCRLASGKVTALLCNPAGGQEVEGPLTNLTGRDVDASSQQISQRAVLCYLLLDRKDED